MAPVFRDLDQDALDREYDNQRKVGNFPDIIAAWSEESAIARDGLDHLEDIPYGAGERETLDVFPASSGARSGSPIHIFIHGGYWHANDKSNHSTVALGLKPHGVATVVMNYGRAPETPFAALVDQCRRAVAWARAHAAEFRADASAITLSGHSAGAHLAAMLLTEESGDDVGARAVFGISGLYDLEPIRRSYLNKTLRLDEATAAEMSPSRRAPAPRSRFVAFVGGREGPEYERQSAELFYSWSRRADATAFAILAEHDHFSILEELTSADGAIARAISAAA